LLLSKAGSKREGGECMLCVLMISPGVVQGLISNVISIQ